MGDEGFGDAEGEVPGLSFMSTFILMQEFIDKLKLLNYESEFSRAWGFRGKSSSIHYLLLNKLVFSL